MCEDCRGGGKSAGDTSLFTMATGTSALSYIEHRSSGGVGRTSATLKNSAEFGDMRLCAQNFA
jgi:hypothetical protein